MKVKRDIIERLVLEAETADEEMGEALALCEREGYTVRKQRARKWGFLVEGEREIDLHFTVQERSYYKKHPQAWPHRINIMLPEKDAVRLCASLLRQLDAGCSVLAIELQGQLDKEVKNDEEWEDEVVPKKRRRAA